MTVYSGLLSKCARISLPQHTGQGAVWSPEASIIAAQHCLDVVILRSEGLRAEGSLGRDYRPLHAMDYAVQKFRPELIVISTHPEERSAWLRQDIVERAKSKYVKLALPGPTGEDNTLWFEPRGTVGCQTETLSRLLEQLAAAWATGNRAPVPDTEVGRRLVRVINHPDIEFTRDIVGAGIQALLFAGTAIDAATLQRSLADREETIVPLVTERQDGGYDLYRLVAEKVVSINTTAAGGNASLMSL